MTLEDEGTYEYQQDRNLSQSGDMSQTQEETVLSRQDGSDLPVTRRYSFPTFRGAMVLSPGAGSPAVELAVKEAVSVPSCNGNGAAKGQRQIHKFFCYICAMISYFHRKSN